MSDLGICATGVAVEAPGGGACELQGGAGPNGGWQVGDVEDGRDCGGAGVAGSAAGGGSGSVAEGDE